ERLGDAASLLGEHALELGCAEHPARGEASPVAVEPGTPDRDQLALVHLLEEVGAGRVDQPDATAHERQRPRIREAARLRLADVDDDADARLHQLLGRDAVEVGVVDDRDVVGPQPADEVLRAPVETRMAGVLDERAHVRTDERNSAPPSILWSSSPRSLSDSGWIRVWVGSPGTFSTRKWRSATLAICGRCVIVITWARVASRCRISATLCAVSPPMPASISSNTIVSPPATAAIASAMRESSPPEAVSATGPNGRPRLGRIMNATSSTPVGLGSRSRSSATNSPSPRPMSCSST